MTVWQYFVTFFLCTVAVASFCTLLNVPKESVLPSSITSAVAYLIFCALKVNTNMEIFAYFVAAFVISVASEIFARIFKKPSTVFIFPGIIPLVPGVGLYNTMLYLIRNDYSEFMITAANTLFISGAIAIAVAIVHIAARSAFPRKNGILSMASFDNKKE